MQLSTVVNKTMSSREIAALTGKQHKHVLDDCRKMFESLNIQSAEFSADYQDERGRTYQEYLLDQDLTMTLITGYSIPLRHRVAKRWRELEQGQIIPQSLPEALRLAADLAEQKAALENQLAIAAPKAQFVDSYVNATGSLGFRETCKLLHIKENAFRKFLLDSQIMYLLAGKLTPYAQHIDAGRFTVKTGENQLNGHAFTQTKFTPKGIQWIAGLWAASQLQDAAA